MGQLYVKPKYNFTMLSSDCTEQQPRVSQNPTPLTTRNHSVQENNDPIKRIWYCCYTTHTNRNRNS